MSSMPRPPTCRVKISAPIASSETILHRLKVQNQEIDMSHWRISNRIDRGNFQVLYVAMTQGSVDILKEKKFFLNYLLGQAKFALLGDDPAVARPAEEVMEVEKESEENRRQHPVAQRAQLSD